MHDNFVRGAYPCPLDAERYTGSGITVEGTPEHHRFDDVAQHVVVRDNQVISTCNAGINVDAGHDIRVIGNTIVSAGVYPDGSPGGFFWVGTSVWNGANLTPDVFKDITVEHNTIGFIRAGSGLGTPHRQDVGDGVDAAKNAHLPDPITLDTERAEWDRWQAKLAAAHVTVGNDRP